jgi:septal ring-binding cell division protein DamX
MSENMKAVETGCWIRGCTLARTAVSSQAQSGALKKPSANPCLVVIAFSTKSPDQTANPPPREAAAKKVVDKGSGASRQLARQPMGAHPPLELKSRCLYKNKAA